MAKSNKNMLIVLCVALVVLVAGGAYYFINLQASSAIEESVRAYLQNSELQVKTVAYNSGDETLTLKDVQYKPKNFPNFSAVLDEIVLKKPNVAAFDAATTGLPAVAESVTLKNIRGSLKTESLELEYKEPEVRIIGWQQNLGKVVAAQKQGLNEAFFVALLDLKADRIEAQGYDLTGKALFGAGKAADIKVQLDSYEISDISGTVIGKYLLKNLKSSVKENDETVSFDVGTTTMENVALPSPAYWAIVAQLYPKLLNNTLTEDEQALLVSNADTTTNVLEKFNLVLKDIIFQVKDDRNDDKITLQGFDMASNLDTDKQQFAKFAIGLTGLAIPLDLLDLSEENFKQFANILGHTVAVDLSLNLDFSEGGKKSIVEFMGGIQKMGHSSAKFQGSLPDGILARVLSAKSGTTIEFTEEEMETLVLGTLLSEAEVSYKDDGFAPAILAAISTQAGKKPQELWGFLSTMAVSELQKNIPSIDEHSILSFEQCLNQPGTVTMSAKPKSALMLPAILLIYATAPEQLGLNISCDPGENILKASEKYMKTSQ